MNTISITPSKIRAGLCNKNSSDRHHMPHARMNAAAASRTRTPLDPSRYYVPPNNQEDGVPAKRRYSHEVQWHPTKAVQEAVSRPVGMQEVVEIAGRNVLTCSSASGGVGTTTSAAILAQRLSQHHAPAALVDADLRVAGGGLDVMLGLEHERGVRWHDVHAPLGQLNGTALQRQLPHWEKVGVLSHNPWQGEQPQWWEVQAAVQALAGENKVVVVDVGHGELIEQVVVFVEASHIVFVELSVLGLARAQMHIEWLEQLGLRSVEQRNTPPRIGQELKPMAAVPGQIVAIVGVEPRGVSRARGIVSIEEAGDYLEREVIGPIHTDGRMCGDVLEGLGIRSVPRKNLQIIDELTSIAEHACSLDSTRKR